MCRGDQGMGAASSKSSLKRADLEKLHKSTNCAAGSKEVTLTPAVSIDQIADLHRHFKSISSSLEDDGVIDRKEFQRALGLKVELARSGSR